MSVLIETGERLGLRALGSGGRIAVASYDQIARTVRDLLSDEHANLFAEPSFRGGTIDWFANFDTAAPALRIEAVAENLRDEGRRRLEQLFGEVSQKAEDLRKSTVEAERILGEMIAYALEVPDENHVWLVGTQPVLTFWGHVKDHGRPAENPIQSVIRRRMPPSALPPATPASPSGAAGTLAPAATLPPTGQTPLFLGALLWSIFTALLVAVGVMLLRSCALGLPVSLTGWLLNSCPASADPALVAALGEERARQANLQAEYERLSRDASLKRQACTMKRSFADDPSRGIPEVPTVPKGGPKTDVNPGSGAPSGPVLQLDREEPKGCYRADVGTGIVDAKSNAPLSIVFCFEKGGTGRQIIKSGDGKMRCEGSINWTRVDRTLVTDAGEAKCTNGTTYSSARVTCRPDSNNEALCTETYAGSSSGGWKDRRFVGVDGSSL